MFIRKLARLLTLVILGPALVSARPPNTQRNYGLFGNVLASLVDVLRGRFSSSYSERHEDAKEKGIHRRKRNQGKRKGYGPLGRLLVTFIGESLGYVGGGGSRAVSLQDADPQASLIVMPAEGCRGTYSTDSAEEIVEKRQTSSSGERLRALREFLRVLWSNFLPDPTFDRAVQRLLQQDASELDMVLDAEGYITASQREQLFAWAGECNIKQCMPTGCDQ